jgi:hypothetical protein
MGAARRLRRVLGRDVVEGEQDGAILDQALRRLVVLGAVFGDEAIEGFFGGFPVLGLVDRVQVFPRLALHRRRQLVEDVGRLVHP